MHLFLYLLAFVPVITAAVLPEAAFEVKENTSSCSVASPDNVAIAKAAFTSASLVPDVIPSFTPVSTVQANYNVKQVDLGNTFSVTGTSVPD